MKRTMQQGFTLIELMIVVAIIGILAAVALPAYQDYTTRAKVSEVVLAASGARTSIAEAYATNGEFPSTTSEIANYVISQSSPYVASVTFAVDNSKGVITATAKGDSRIANETITLTGTPDSNGTVSWVCGGSIDPKYRPASCK